MWWLWSGARAWDARQRRSRPHQSMIDIFPAGVGEPVLPPLKSHSPGRADLSF
jgi:hypothetical protein